MHGWVGCCQIPSRGNQLDVHASKYVCSSMTSTIMNPSSKEVKGKKNSREIINKGKLVYTKV